MKVLCVVGARPNFVKMAPIIREIESRPGEIESLLVHTGQHYDEQMAGSFFRDLKLRPPEIDLGIGSGSHTEQVARIMLAFEPVVESSRPDWLLVVGDVNSTLASTLVAVRLGIRIAHVEAGLRSGDRGMPEEINRVLTDQLADLLLTPSEDADNNLLRAGIAAERIVRVGNVMIDSLYTHLPVAESSTIRERLNVQRGNYAVLTLHRPVNVDDRHQLEDLLQTMGEIASRLSVIFPVHPRTRERIDRWGLVMPPGLCLIDPQPYPDFLRLWSGARLVCTDSGGLQEETSALGIPCLTLRETTERPVTIELGTNHLVGTGRSRIIDTVDQILAAPWRLPDVWPPNPGIPLWDGRTAARIVDALLEHHVSERRD